MIDSIKSWAATNWKGLIFLCAAFCLAVLLFAMQGCSWGDIITTKTPAEVQAAVGAPPRTTLNEAEVYMSAFRDYTNAYVRKNEQVLGLYANSINSGWEVAGFLGAATNVGVTGLASGAWSGLPLGGVGLSLLSLAGGLLIKGPGTGKEKEKSFKKGQDEAVRLLTVINPNLNVPEDLTNTPPAPA